jgi:hypothetical protein
LVVSAYGKPESISGFAGGPNPNLIPTKINFELIVALWGLANSIASDMRHQARGLNLKCNSQQRAWWFDRSQVLVDLPTRADH